MPARYHRMRVVRIQKFRARMSAMRLPAGCGVFVLCGGIRLATVLRRSRMCQCLQTTLLVSIRVRTYFLLAAIRQHAQPRISVLVCYEY